LPTPGLARPGHGHDARRRAQKGHIPDRVERERDRRPLAHFLTPAIAAAAASLPVIALDPGATSPLALRADAWLYRSGELLARAADEFERLRVVRELEQAQALLNRLSPATQGSH